MTKDEMSTLLRSVGCDENTVTAMENAYEMGFEQGAQVNQAMREAIEVGVSMCEHLDFDELLTAKQMADTFRSILREMQ